MLGTTKLSCFVILILALALTTTDINAQETQAEKPWYGGVFAGYFWGDLHSNVPGHEESTGDYNDNSPMVGVNFGYELRLENNWFVGAEAIIPLYVQKGTAVDKVWYPDQVSYEAVYKWGFLVAAKGGYKIGRTSPYAFAAAGATNVEGRTLNVDENDLYSEGFVQSASAVHFIWQAGAGVDYDITNNIFVGVRAAAFMGARADHTMSWNSENETNKFGYNSFLIQINGGFRF